MPSVLHSGRGAVLTEPDLYIVPCHRVEKKGAQGSFKHEVDVRRTDDDVLNRDSGVWIIDLP